jgi:LPXTG-motif cell wall-anchored protein
MLTGWTFRKRAMALTALALSAGAIFGQSGHVSAAVPGTSCTSEQSAWTGLATLGSTTGAYDTGVVVPAVPGTELVVVGVSADGLTSTGAARVMAVTVGGAAAVPGAVVPGGAVVLVGDGAPAEVRSVIVVLNRCAQVAQAAPTEPTAPASPPATVDPVSTVSTVSTVNTSSATLPRTGSTVEMNGSLIGGLAVGLGSAMVVAGRRRAAR